MEVAVESAAHLVPGAVEFPPGVFDGESTILRVGCNAVSVRRADGAWASEAPAPEGQPDEAPAPEGQPGRLTLAADIFAQLALPYSGIRMLLEPDGPGQLKLGPSLAALWAGSAGAAPPSSAARRVGQYFGHLQSEPGLFALGYEDDVDWDPGTIGGYVLDNRPGRQGSVLPARFPIPDAVHLTWAIDRTVIDRLRERTGGRTFNWVRSIGKWQFHQLLSADPGLAGHLPETRLLAGPASVAALLTRHETVFVKNVHSIRGRGVARVHQVTGGLEVRHMSGTQLVQTQFATLAELIPYVRTAVGAGRCVVQQGIPITGRTGRAADFRVMVVRAAAGEWYAPTAIARVAPDDRLVITNVANGAKDAGVVPALTEQYGFSAAGARRVATAMVDLCLAAARTLAAPFHPLGILGFDVAVATDTHHLWLLEANPVPGWGYPPPLDAELARSQINFGLLLTGYGRDGAGAGLRQPVPPG